MKKFFKVMGTGAAIGTLAYGVIKYKHDQQFKEKVDNTAEKAEEKADKAMTKLSSFATKHPGLTAFGIITILMAPATILSFTCEKRRQEIINEQVNDYLERIPRDGVGDPKYDDIYKNPKDYVVIPKHEYLSYKQEDERKSRTPVDCFSNWDENKYRKNWDAVSKFAQDLILEDGESYLLEDAKQYNVPCDHAMISHLIDGTGCYPPECKNDIII